MKLRQIRDDTRGSSLIEFTITFPLFLLLMFGLVQAGLLFYAQNGLQHGVEAAARCASVNYSVIILNDQYPSNNITESCFTVNGTPAPGSVTGATIKQYAVQNTWGLVPSSSSYTVGCPGTSTTGCSNNNNTCVTGSPGYSVSVSHTYTLIYYLPITLTAKSCFPINIS
jgi:Flp pilus assembly protein TadG